MADKKISVDIYSRHIYNNVRWIPSPVSRESPQLGYQIGLTDTLSLLQHSEVWLYDSNTKRILNLTNLNDYFPDYVPAWSRGGGGGGSTSKTYVVSATTAEWDAQSSLISEKDVMYVYTDYTEDSSGTLLPGIKVGDGVTLLSQLPFTASSTGGSGGEKEVYSKTKEEWDAQPTLVSKKDTLYIYTDHRSVNDVLVPGIKVGDGVTTVVNLPFTDDSIISEDERETWNEKVSAEMSMIPGDEEELILFNSIQP